jgi:hypothetical protein
LVIKYFFGGFGEMKKVIFILMVLSLVGVANAMFTEDFDTFSLGTLVAQESWEASSYYTIVTTASSGEYVGGQALKTTSAANYTTRQDATGVLFNLDPNHSSGVEYGFDFCETSTSGLTCRLYLRAGTAATYSPSFGFNAGVFHIRTQGEGGTAISGNALGSYSGTLWNKGDWVRMRIILKGSSFNYATVYAYNLTRSVDIPTGLKDVYIGTNPSSTASSWNRMNFRTTGSSGTNIDNVYVKDYVNPNPVAETPSPMADAYPVDGNGVVLGWTSDARVTSHKVYLGTATNALVLQTEVTQPSYAVPYALSKGTTYYWRIDEVVSGTQYEGNVWAFTTAFGTVTLPRQMAYEGFDYEAYQDLKAGSAGYGGYGWATGWENSSSTGCNVEVGSGSLTPTFNYPFGTNGNMIQHTNNATVNDAWRKLTNPIDLRLNQDYYISYLVQCGSEGYNTASVYLYDSKGGSSLFGANMFYTGYPGVTSADFALREPNGAWTSRQFGSWVGDTVYMVVMKISAHVTGKDTVYMSVFSPSNPPSENEPATWDANFTVTQNSIYSWLAFSGRADAYDQFYFDEIHVGTGWGAVTGFVQACGDLGTIMNWDLNQDCRINFKDFAELASDWLKCTVPGGLGCEMLVDGKTATTVFSDIASNDLIVYETTSPITVDGNLSDWSGVRWYNARFSTGYNASLAADITNAQVALLWNQTTPQTVYLAVKVTDTSHQINDNPDYWAGSDSIEFRFSTNATSTDTSWSATQNHDYDIAQLYQAGATSTGTGWCSLGGLGGHGVDAYTYMPAQNTIDVSSAVVQSGSDYIYEFAIPTYSDFAGIKGGTSSKLTLANNDVIAFDLQLDDYTDGTSGAGLFDNQSQSPNDWSKFTVRQTSSFNIGDFGYFDTDIDHNGVVGFSDVAVIAEKWLSCTDPQITGCDQPWLP